MNTREPRFETVASIRQQLRLSRSEFARFLGVSEATIVRWEVKDSISEPKGLQAVLIRAIKDAMATESSVEIARLIRGCGLDHRAALRRLLAAGGGPDGSERTAGRQESGTPAPRVNLAGCQV